MSTLMDSYNIIQTCQRKHDFGDLVFLQCSACHYDGEVTDVLEDVLLIHRTPPYAFEHTWTGNIYYFLSMSVKHIRAHTCLLLKLYRFQIWNTRMTCHVFGCCGCIAANTDRTRGLLLPCIFPLKL